MKRIRHLLAVAVTVLAVAGCATVNRLDAANDVHALLLSIRDGDQAAFDAFVDRPSLKREIQARMMAEADKHREARGLAALLAPTLADLAGEAVLRPQVFKAVAARYGYDERTRIPPPVAIAQRLRTLPDGRVCATKTKDGPCQLMFSQVDGVWKLSGFEGDMNELRIRR